MYLFTVRHLPHNYILYFILEGKQLK